MTSYHFYVDPHQDDYSEERLIEQMAYFVETPGCWFFDPGPQTLAGVRKYCDKPEVAVKGSSLHKTDQELFEILEATHILVLPGSFWRHKMVRTIYKVCGTSLRESDLEPLVTYRKDGLYWTRTLTEFLERFEKVL